MTLAERLVQASRPLGTEHAARELDRLVRKDNDADPEITAWCFSDGSVACSKGRGRNFQLWVAS